MHACSAEKTFDFHTGTTFLQLLLLLLLLLRGLCYFGRMKGEVSTLLDKYNITFFRWWQEKVFNHDYYSNVILEKPLNWEENVKNPMARLCLSVCLQTVNLIISNPRLHFEIINNLEM